MPGYRPAGSVPLVEEVADGALDHLHVPRDGEEPVALRSLLPGGLEVGGEASQGDPPRPRRRLDPGDGLLEEAEILLGAIGGDLRPIQPDPLESLRQVGILFALDASGTRADFLLSDTPHDVEAIARARRIDPHPGVTIRVCTPEDLVIYKLVATRARDHEDASTVIRRQAAALDAAYILRWLGEFEKALDDSTLIATFESLRSRWRSRP